MMIDKIYREIMHESEKSLQDTLMPIDTTILSLDRNVDKESDRVSLVERNIPGGIQWRHERSAYALASALLHLKVFQELKYFDSESDISTLVKDAEGFINHALDKMIEG